MTSGIRKTYDLKQVKVTTSILWLLNKAETRNVFFSSMDIYLDKDTLQLHSLIIRGLISGELYCAAISNIFPAISDVKNRDIESVIAFINDQTSKQLNGSNCDKLSFDLSNLTNQYPFDLTGHLKLIDSLMTLHLYYSDLNALIPTIVGKLCNYRPNSQDPKLLLQIWFKSIACLSISKQNIKEMENLMRSIIMCQENEVGSSTKKYFDNIKFSDKLALIMFHEQSSIGFHETFKFDFNSDGSTTRENIKHNFMSLLSIIRRNKLPKVLEDFKELMLILNSSHMQLTANIHVNIDVFVLEFFFTVENICNHANRTFRTAHSQNEKSPKKYTTSMIIPIKNTNVKPGHYSQTLNKNPLNSTDTNSPFGTYTNRKRSTENLKIEPITKMNWSDVNNNNINENGNTNKITSPLSLRPKKQSLQLDFDYTSKLNNKNQSNSDYSISDGTLKAKYLAKAEESKHENKMTWAQSNNGPEKTDLQNDNESLNVMPERKRANETRLRLNMKRKEIEQSRRRLQEQKMREKQILSEQIFREFIGGPSNTSSKTDRQNSVTSTVSSNKKIIDESSGAYDEDDESDINNSDIYLDELEVGSKPSTTRNSSRRSKVSDIKKRHHKNDNDDRKRNNSVVTVTRSKSQDISKYLQVNSINESIDALKNQITKLTDEHARLSARLDTPVTDTVISSTPVAPVTTTPVNQTMATMPLVTDTSPNNYFSPMSVGLAKGLSNYPSYSPVSELRQQHTYLYSHQLSPPTGIRYMFKDENEQKPVPTDLTDAKKPETKAPIEAISDSVAPAKIDNSLPIEITDKPPVEVASSDKPELPLDKPTTFFVDFDGDQNGKKLGKKPLKLRNGNVKNGNGNKAPISKIGNDVDIPVDKPVAFVVTMEDKNTPNASENTIDKDKLSLIAEKREQERKEKLEKTKLNNRRETENRLQKEEEKERIKLEKIAKREAIFEAYKKRKEEQEQDGNRPEPPHASRRDTKSIKRNARVLSAAPSIRRTQNNNNPKSPGDGNASINSNESMSNSVMHSNSSKNSVSHLKQNHSGLPSNNNNSSLNHRSSISSIEAPPSTKLFVQPKHKSNKSVILNAIKHCCLAGKVQEALKLQSMEDVENNPCAHYVILMRGGCQFRGLYGFDADSESLWKFSGTGPKRITTKMVDKFFKYNSGAKKFSEITSTSHLSTVIDGIMIYNTLWKSNNSNNHAGNHSQLPGTTGPSSITCNSETSSQADFSSP